VFVREVFCALSRRIRHLVRRPYPGLSRTLHGHVHGRVFTSEVYAAFRTGNVRIQGGDLARCIVRGSPQRFSNPWSEPLE
jgi:hypothetical protein